MSRQNKEEIISQSTPSIVPSIADAIVIKDDNLFCITDRDGCMPLRGHHGFGLYYNDCRYLDGYRLSLGDFRAQTLVSNASREFVSVFQLANEEFIGVDGVLIRKEQLGVKWKRVINAKRLLLCDAFRFQNFGLETATFDAVFQFHAGFQDIFMVRGFARESRGVKAEPKWEGDMLHFQYFGEDKYFRNLFVQFSPAPSYSEGTEARFRLELKAGGKQEITIAFYVSESMDEHARPLLEGTAHDLSSIETIMERDCRRWLTNEAKIESDSLSLNRAMVRSFRDLRVLESSIDGRSYFAAGIPWFATLFGRDGLITALQTLAYNPTIAEEILLLLARYQGQKVDAWRDEAPGKILHELRFGELARIGEIPHTPYYGTVDSTPLFLVLLSRHARWTGRLDLFNELEGAVEMALTWMDQFGDIARDGYLKYESNSTRGLTNQGWKDSWDGIVNADGSLASPPIALVEVQGYMYEAKLGIADLYAKVGNLEKAGRLQREAHVLREKFNVDFWLEDQKCFAVALQEGHRPVASIASNAGHALWSGIADYTKAKMVCERLLQPDMFSGWGIRTLSENEKRYNPLGYHLGTVWPHDNALIAAGFKRYGFTEAAQQVFRGLFRATTYFEEQRLPELFSGFSDRDYEVPVHYPVACHPQAWAAGTVPYLMEVLLGLEPDAFTRRLKIVRPALPDRVNRLELRDLRVGDARVDLGFYRTERNSIAVEVLRREGALEIIVEPGVRDEVSK